MRSVGVLPNVCIPMLTKEGIDVISLDVILVVNGIHSTMANMESCSVMITLTVLTLRWWIFLQDA